MIRFTCKQCGKTYEHPEGDAGTIVFCECGAGNAVPRESAPAVSAPEEQPLLAVPFDAPAPPVPIARPVLTEVPATAAVCLNHLRVTATHTCTDCGMSFCADCVLALEGRVRCGPCKNFYVRNLSRPPQLSVAAIFSVIVAVVSAPMALISQSVGIASGSPQAVLVITAVCLGMELVAIILAAFALSNLERSARIGGRGIAISGLVTGLVALVLTVEVAIHALRMLG